MKTFYVAWALCLCCLPGVSQIAPLRPRFVQVDTTTLNATRSWMQRADSTIHAAGSYVAELQQKNTVLRKQVNDRAAEVERERNVNAVLQVDNEELNERIKKTLALPLQKDLLLDPRTYKVGGAAVAFGILFGLLLSK